MVHAALLQTVLTVVGGDSWHYYYGKRRPQNELWIMVKELLEGMK